MDISNAIDKGFLSKQHFERALKSFIEFEKNPIFKKVHPSMKDIFLQVDSETKKRIFIESISHNDNTNKAIVYYTFLLDIFEKSKMPEVEKIYYSLPLYLATFEGMYVFGIDVLTYILSLTTEPIERCLCKKKDGKYTLNLEKLENLEDIKKLPFSFKCKFIEKCIKKTDSKSKIKELILWEYNTLRNKIAHLDFDVTTEGILYYKENNREKQINFSNIKKHIIFFLDFGQSITRSITLEFSTTEEINKFAKRELEEAFRR